MKNSRMAMNRFGRGEEIIFVERITLFDRFFNEFRAGTTKR